MSARTRSIWAGEVRRIDRLVRKCDRAAAWAAIRAMTPQEFAKRFGQQPGSQAVLRAQKWSATSAAERGVSRPPSTPGVS